MFAMRLMGKRQAGELQPFELVIAIMIADVASMPMTARAFHYIRHRTYCYAAAAAQLHSVRNDEERKAARRRFRQTSIIIHKGVIVEKELKRLNYNFKRFVRTASHQKCNKHKRRSLCRTRNERRIKRMLKPQKRNLQPADMNINPPNPGFCYDVILDGKLKRKNLEGSALRKKI
jgi:uncharacterized membrane protein YcaP (DUF421 family)